MKNSQTRVSLKTVYQRANRAAGQLSKIEKMVRAGRSKEDILNMLLAAEGSVQSLIYKHFSKLISRHLVEVLEDLADSGDLSPELEIFIMNIRKRRPGYKPNELPKVFYDLKQFGHPSYC